MKPVLLFAALSVVGTVMTAVPASAQVAGSTMLGITVTEASRLTLGWSVKKSVLGKTLYNDVGQTIGKVQDLIIAPDQGASYLVVSAGGFIGVGAHDVAIPVSQVQEQQGRLVMAGATKDVVASMPRFEYANDATEREQLVANANAGIAMAKDKLVSLQKDAETATADIKAKAGVQAANIQVDLKSTEEKLAEMNRAGVKRWKEFEGDLSAATARLRKSVETALG